MYDLSKLSLTRLYAMLKQTTESPNGDSALAEMAKRIEAEIASRAR